MTDKPEISAELIETIHRKAVSDDPDSAQWAMMLIVIHGVIPVLKDMDDKLNAINEAIAPREAGPTIYHPLVTIAEVMKHMAGLPSIHGKGGKK
jgi:hypothetical protein